MNRLEDLLQNLLIEMVSNRDNTILSLNDQKKIFATAVELSLTRASSQRILNVTETLLKCYIKSHNNLSFPLPRTLLILTNKIKNSILYPLRNEMIIDEYKIENYISKSKKMGSIVCDGKYLYIYNTFGLYKIGTGYQGTIKGKIYIKKDVFYNQDLNKIEGCLLIIKKPKLSLLFRSPLIKPHHFCVINISTLKFEKYLDLKYENNINIDLKKYSPAFVQNNHLCILNRITPKKYTDKDDKYEIFKFDTNDDYKFYKKVKMFGPTNISPNNDNVGGIYGAGGNAQGEFGVGNNTRVTKIKCFEWCKSMNLTQFKQIAGGNQWHGFVTHDGLLYVAGHNSSGQFGLGHTRQENTLLLHEFYKKLGKVKMIGHGTYANHMIVLMENGDVYSHGSGYDSQLGIGYDSTQTTPKKIKKLANEKIIYVSCDHKFSAFINTKGELFTCGRDDNGAIGHGTQTKRSSIPIKVKALEGIKIVSVACAYTHMIMLDGMFYLIYIFHSSLLIIYLIYIKIEVMFIVVVQIAMVN